jgi:hypothetical protein
MAVHRTSAPTREVGTVLPDHHRLKGGALLLGASGPGEAGPFGVWPVEEPGEDADQEQQDQADTSVRHALTDSGKPLLTPHQTC